MTLGKRQARYPVSVSRQLLLPSIVCIRVNIHMLATFQAHAAQHPSLEKFNEMIHTASLEQYQAIYQSHKRIQRNAYLKKV